MEIVQGLPCAISIIPVLFIFAPGSSSVLSVIGVMHREAGDIDTIQMKTRGHRCQWMHSLMALAYTWLKRCGLELYVTNSI